jgi:Mg-chelatase subunit ChlD
MDQHRDSEQRRSFIATSGVGRLVGLQSRPTRAFGGQANGSLRFSTPLCDTVHSVTSVSSSARTLIRLAVLALLILGVREFRRERAREERARDVESAAPYQAEVDESLGAAVAILIDTSGSMRDTAPGDSRPKHVVAREALEAMLDATDAFVARRPDFPIKIGLYNFSSGVWTRLPIQPYNREAIRRALDELPPPGGGTAIGNAMRAARPDLYRAGVFRKYLLVVTDGENTTGRDPERVARDIRTRSEGAVQMYFVAFDTSPRKFDFLKEVGGNVLAAGSGVELRQALDEIYHGKILAEQVDAGEREPRRP